jgi:hypothetical protein
MAILFLTNESCMARSRRTRMTQHTLQAIRIPPTNSDGVKMEKSSPLKPWELPGCFSEADGNAEEELVSVGTIDMLFVRVRFVAFVGTVEATLEAVVQIKLGDFGDGNVGKGGRDE